MILGIGMDLVEIDRVGAALTRTPSMRRRLFTPQEQSDAGERMQSLAARFAAKEAVAKALGSGIRGFTFLDIEVVRDDLGRPLVLLHRGASARATSVGIQVVHLSLSTSLTVAGAYAVAEGQGAPGAAATFGLEG